MVNAGSSGTSFCPVPYLGPGKTHWIPETNWRFSLLINDGCLSPGSNQEIESSDKMRPSLPKVCTFTVIWV